jgi:hypothetical protein
MVHHVHHCVHGSGFRVISTINQPPNTGMYERSRAHGAWLDCSKQVTVAQAMVADHSTCLSESDHFSMSGGIVVSQVAVPASADDLAPVNNYRAYGNFAAIERTLRAAQRLLHPEFIRILGGIVTHANDCILRDAGF